jgi:hypothetical protein
MLTKIIMSGGESLSVDPSVPSPSEDMVAKPSHDSDSDDDCTDTESVLCLLPVVAPDSPHLDSAHRGCILSASRLNDTRMGSDIGLSTQEGSGFGLSTPEDSNCALLPPLALLRRSQSKKRRAATGTDHPYAHTKVGSSSAITNNQLTALLVCFSVATPLPDHSTPYLYEDPHFQQTYYASFDEPKFNGDALHVLSAGGV